MQYINASYWLAFLVCSIFFLSGLDGLLHLRESPGCRKFSDIQAWGNLIDSLLQILPDFTNPISINQTLFWLCQPLCKCCSVSPFLLSGIWFQFQESFRGNKELESGTNERFLAKSFRDISQTFPKIRRHSHLFQIGGDLLSWCHCNGLLVKLLVSL